MKAAGGKPVGVGVIGCGAISGAYLGMGKQFGNVEVVACADLDLSRAAAKAKEFGIARACGVEELLGDAGVELVVNLTVPRAHAEVSMAALNAGKHVYQEKPLAVDRESGRGVMELAREKGLLVGCAPDTFMGSGIQTARKGVEAGVIGKAVAFTAFMMGRGHESWHPSPEFYYEVGGGPMFDMGPYYLTALLQILGPVKRVMGSAGIAIGERTITSEPKKGKVIRVETPDHICGLMEFENGCSGVMIQSFATMHPQYDGGHPITIYGTEGTMKVPDPNQFDGAVLVRGAGDGEFRELDLGFVKGYGRGVGVADMACAIRSGRGFRANGNQAMAVLDLMAGFMESATSGGAFTPGVQFVATQAMRADLPLGELEE